MLVMALRLQPPKPTNLGWWWRGTEMNSMTGALGCRLFMGLGMAFSMIPIILLIGVCDVWRAEMIIDKGTPGNLTSA
jgi:hypothetical protein